MNFDDYERQTAEAQSSVLRLVNAILEDSDLSDGDKTILLEEFCYETAITVCRGTEQAKEQGLNVARITIDTQHPPAI